MTIPPSASRRAKRASGIAVRLEARLDLVARPDGDDRPSQHATTGASAEPGPPTRRRRAARLALGGAPAHAAGQRRDLGRPVDQQAGRVAVGSTALDQAERHSGPPAPSARRRAALGGLGQPQLEGHQRGEVAEADGLGGGREAGALDRIVGRAHRRGRRRRAARRAARAR